MSSSHASTLYQETFDADAATTVEFVSAYPAFAAAVGAGREVTAAAGQAVITNTLEDNGLGLAVVRGFPGEVTYSVEIGATLCDGAFNIGMLIGSTRVAFHPGYPGGALRVEGFGGFGNQDMGFTPANGVLHRLEVKQNAGGVVGLFEITFTDGENPANVYTNSWIDASLVGQDFGIYRSGPLSGESGLFDNLMASDGAADPLQITEIALLPNEMISLTWISLPGASYTVLWSENLINFDADVTDDVGSQGETTTFVFENPTLALDPPLEVSPELFFKVRQNSG